MRSLPCEVRLRELGLFCKEENAHGGISSLCINGGWYNTKMHIKALFSGAKWQDKKQYIHLNMENSVWKSGYTFFYCERERHVAQRACEIITLGDIQKLYRQSPKQKALGCAAWAQNVGPGDLQRPHPVSASLWFWSCICTVALKRRF